MHNTYVRPKGSLPIVKWHRTQWRTCVIERYRLQVLGAEMLERVQVSGTLERGTVRKLIV